MISFLEKTKRRRIITPLQPTGLPHTTLVSMPIPDLFNNAPDKFGRAVFYANNSEFKQALPEEQQLAAACTALIQNSIVLWNYLYLSEVLVNCKQQSERDELVTLIKNGSVMVWAHVNLHGEFGFRRYSANQTSFSVRKILSMEVEVA